MKSLKFASIALALGFAIQLGCGSDSGTTHNDGATLGGTGGMMTGLDAGTGGTPVDAPIVTGTGGSIDAPVMTGGTGGTVPMDAGMGGMMYDAAMTGGAGGSMDGGPAIIMDGGGEAGPTPVVDICTGLTQAACHLAVINAPVDPGVLVQDLSAVPTPPSYLTCSQ